MATKKSVSNKSKTASTSSEEKVPSCDVTSAPVTAITYRGNVTIKTQLGGKITSKINLHNNGTDTFFKYLLRAVVGGYDKRNMPQRIDVGNTSGTGPDKKYGDYLNYNCPITGVVDESKMTATFTGYVPFTAFATQPSESSPINTVRILSSLRSEVLAELDLGDARIPTLLPGTSLIVTWVMSFDNADSKSV